MSPELKQFYRDLQVWIDAGCPSEGIFENDCGVCVALQHWSRAKDISNIKRSSLNIELANQFIEKDLKSSYPWGFNDYADRCGNDTMYECPHRLAWIKEHAQ